MTTLKALAERAIPLAQSALKIEDYNLQRSELQKLIGPLFDAVVPHSKRLSILLHSEFFRGGHIAAFSGPGLSNFCQRLNVDTILWVLRCAHEETTTGWADSLIDSMMERTKAAYSRGDYRFGYPPAATVSPNANRRFIETFTLGAASATPPTEEEPTTFTTPVTTKGTSSMTTTSASTTAAVAAAPMKELLGLTMPEIIDVIDHLVSRGHSESDINGAFELLYEPTTTLSGATALRSARGPLGATFGLPAMSPGANDVFVRMNDHLNAAPSVVGGGEPEPEAKATPAASWPKLALPDASTRDLMDRVMAAAGLPTTEKLIEQANAAAEADRLLKEALARPPVVIEKIPEMTVKGVASLPGGKVVLKKAYDVFGVTDPKHRKMFDFDVPYGEWDSAHPYVPTQDPDYLFNPALMVPFLLAVVHGDNPWLRGHTGTGKTTFVEQIYARLNLPVYRVNLDSDITRSELVGRDVIKQDEDGKTISVFQQGIIPRVMQEPCALLLDEVDASRPDLGFVLQRLTEGKGFMLLEDGGKTIVPHPWFRLFATANTNGRGDETGLYTGTRVLGSAFVDRFKPFLEVQYMDAKSEMKLLSAKAPTLPKAEVERIVSYAKEHRIAFTQAQVTLPCSPRLTVTIAKQIERLTPLFDVAQARKMAFAQCVANAADADDKVVLAGIADRTILVKS